MKLYLLLFLLSSYSFATVPEICHKFAKDPASFKASDNLKECPVSEDLGGTCRSVTLSCSGGYVNTKSDGAYYGLSEIGIRYKDKLYNFLSTRHDDLFKTQTIGEITKKGTVILCDVHQKIKEVKLINSSETLCKDLYAGKLQKVDLLNSKEVFDLERNGSKISYVNSGFVSGAGCGCDLETYKAKSIDPSSSSFIKAFNALNSNEPSCSSKVLPLNWSVVRYEKKDYLYLENPGTQSGSLISAYKKIQPEALYEWNGSKFEKLCGKNYELERVATEPELN